MCCSETVYYVFKTAKYKTAGLKCHFLTAMPIFSQQNNEEASFDNGVVSCKAVVYFIHTSKPNFNTAAHRQTTWK